MRPYLSFGLSLLTAVVLALVATRFFTDSFLFAIVHNLQLHLSAIGIVVAALALVIRFNIFGVAVLGTATALFLHGFVLSERFAQDFAPQHGQPFRLLSFNVMSTNTANASSLVNEIVASGADVANIMEAPAVLPELPRLLATYPYRIGCGEKTKGCDLMMVSKYPLDGIVAGMGIMSQQRLIVAKAALPSGPVTVVAIHTTKPYFDSYHAEELQIATQFFNRVQGPFIVSGDFNASSIGPDMQDFLRNTGLRHAAFQPGTWPVGAGDWGVPIDHIYVKAPIGIKQVTRIADAHGSNHYGLIGDLILPPAP
ncbi:Uncharacterized conserved protein YafD, endonuclease/exonuclease/phosphatase (EEP) superfamily [Rhizobium sp. RU35A]|uniref:endonuclease/exonuclease/phosphatase family protein n=1 Tax=Rhizobium sp. RU35A TaxID=1907414 RepID=UPI000955AD06|nr:endonuclease/exonuclease/phosphatase family protein [Rhizobium sp. RU35A]SIQ21988.1 Uncharacterized conserved protein YafD, endonuclease/exonuclease/phosphatase (EEP) superfamily [Rhizobium sp. RU35A]